MNSPNRKQIASLPEAAETPARLPPRVRIALWRIQPAAEQLELVLAEARGETGLPGDMGDRETHDELERAQFALFRLGNYILRRVGRWGGAE